MQKITPLKLARINSGYTQFDLAKELGISEKLISAWETQRAVPLPDMRHRVAKILGKESEQLFPGCY